jgi:hypothetical protein
MEVGRLEKATLRTPPNSKGGRTAALGRTLQRWHLLAGFAGTTVHHRLDGAGVLLGFGEDLLLGHRFRLGLHFDGGLLDVRGTQRAEVIGRLETRPPSVLVHMGEGLEFGAWQEQVKRLRLVDPLLTAGGGINEPLVVDDEGRQVLLLENLGDLRDLLELTIEVLELLDHLLIPEAELLQVADQAAV